MNLQQYRISEYKGNIDRAISLLHSNCDYGSVLLKKSRCNLDINIKYRGLNSRLELIINRDNSIENKLGSSICKIIKHLSSPSNIFMSNKCKNFSEIRENIKKNGFIPYSFLIVTDSLNKKKYMVGLGKSKREIGPCVLVDDEKFGFAVLDIKAFYWSELEWKNENQEFAQFTTPTYKTSTGRSG